VSYQSKVGDYYYSAHNTDENHEKLSQDSPSSERDLNPKSSEYETFGSQVQTLARKPAILTEGGVAVTPY
jgi:hypothetical protein